MALLLFFGMKRTKYYLLTLILFWELFLVERGRVGGREGEREKDSLKSLKSKSLVLVTNPCHIVSLVLFINADDTNDR